MAKERNTAPAATLERPLAARSLIASLLLRSQPPRMSAARLVQWCGLFGVAEGTARVALSRMVDRAELRAADGTYELAGRVGGDLKVAQDWAIAPRPRPWSGAWRLAIVTTGARDATERTALRDAMRHLRFVELREGVWTRPDNLPRASAPAAWWAVADAQCAWWTGQPDADAERLGAELFDGAEWAKGARAHERRLRSVTNRLARDDDRTIADAFIAGAAALGHIRADPLLPAELADPEPGAALRAAYAAFEAAFADAVRRWFRRQ